MVVPKNRAILVPKLGEEEKKCAVKQSKSVSDYLKTKKQNKTKKSYEINKITFYAAYLNELRVQHEMFLQTN